MSILNKAKERVPEGCLLKYKQEKLNLETSTFIWKTDLKPNVGESTIQLSAFPCNLNYYKGIECSVLLDTNYVDNAGTKYLSAFLQLSCPSDDDILATFIIDLLIGPTADDFYSKSSELVEFSKKSSSFGFKEYMPMYRLPQGGNRSYHFRVRLYTFGKDIDVSPKQALNNDEEMDSKAGPDPSAYATDAFLKTGDEIIPVDSQKVSAQSQLLNSQFCCEPEKNMPLDITGISANAKLIKIIVRFCHTGILILPTEQGELAELLKIVKLMEMTEMMKRCEALLMKKLSLDTFTFVAELSSQKLFSQETDLIILNFLTENYDELILRKDYRERLKYFGSHLMFDI
ncbi:unnamed protein product [Orchesella dallaii]|uniref:BTB domain-containing protein n=1 Tax=Orchesella dallaii TaxID=48710 RepID=A0ABP1QTL3_9HEXA